MADRLLVSLLKAGSKACSIAQLCRAEESLFSILIQEKGLVLNNKVDFKTLADVFIQQVAKYEIAAQFPELSDRVYGEENNQFTNTLGETIAVEVKSSEDETMALLSKVLDGNERMAKVFAQSAHAPSDYDIKDEPKRTKLSNCEINVDEIGIWIDPIDGTSQYVNGTMSEPSEENVYPFGLQCVTVLIGAYNLKTGLPVMGVIFQPFYKKEQGCWKSRSFWGVSLGDFHLNNLDEIEQDNTKARSNLTVIASPSDQISCQALKQEQSVKLCTAGGAGYKCLCVIEGLVDAYVYSADACYAWDTCAPHALLLSRGGGIVCFRELLKGSADMKELQLRYNKPNDPPHSPWANVGGLVAYNGSSKSLNCIDLAKKPLFVP